MRIRLFGATAIAMIVAAIASQATFAAGKTVICGQINHGPHATYTFPLNQKKLSGTTWTIFATGAPCAAAMKSVPAVLKWFAKAKVDSYYRANLFVCSKESDGHGSSGSIGCGYSNKARATMELLMTASYSLTELKQMFFIG